MTKHDIADAATRRVDEPASITVSGSDRSMRRAIVTWTGVAMAALLFVVSSKDMAAAGMAASGTQPGGKEGALFADIGRQGDIIARESQTLLQTGSSSVELMDAKGMQLKLSEDLSALDRIIGKGTPTLTSSLLKSSPAARIIARATEVKQAAAKLAGEKENGRKAGGLAMDATGRHAVLEVALDQGVSNRVSHSSPSKKDVTVATTVTMPFASDKGWSVDAENKDMDNFFDSLDHHAAVKEIAARKVHQLHAAEKEKQEKLAEKALERAEESVPAQASSMHHLHTSRETEKTLAHEKRLEPKAVAVQEVGKTSSLTSEHETSGTEVHMKVEAKEASDPKHVMASNESPAAVDVGKKPKDKLTGDARQQELATADVDVTMHHAAVLSDSDVEPGHHLLTGEGSTTHSVVNEALRPPDEQRGKGMSAAALRQDESDYFNKLQTKAKQQAERRHPVTESEEKEGATQVLTDEQARERTEQYFDNQLRHAESKHDAVFAAKKKAENLHMTSSQASADLRHYFEKQEGKTGHKEHSDSTKLDAPDDRNVVHKMSAEQAKQDFESYFAAQTRLAQSEAAEAHAKAEALDKELNKSEGVESGDVREGPARVHANIEDVASASPSAVAAHQVQDAPDVSAMKKVVEPMMEQDKSNVLSKEVQSKEVRSKEHTNREGQKEKQVQVAKDKEEAADEVEGVRKAMGVKEAMTGSEDRADLNRYYSKLVDNARRQKEEDMRKSHALK